MTAITSRLSTALADRYRIERRLGEGGMATVYLAEDLKHKRKVAVKVLRPELAAVLGAERFVQEITTTASFQHPHILTLFDSGEADGFLYYVMPYIEGETLREKLDRETQLGIDEAVRITSDVADALDYAHQQGVIHRDIKPENILLHNGRPMVADFGIALAVSAAAGGRMTETGLSLGTPHYMSPEQATAEKDLSARSDVYSLSSVLYEMLTGNPPHVGASAQQIIMKIVTEEAAPVTTVRKLVPPNVVAAVAKALEKLPADRFESAKAFADALGNTGFSVGSTRAEAAAPAATAHGVARSRFLALVAVAVLLAGTSLWGWFRSTPAPPVSRQQVALWGAPGTGWPNPGGSATTVNGRAAIAPDGSSIVYSDTVTGGIQLFRKARGEALGTAMAGTEAGTNPFFSPDGAWIGYITVDGRLRKVPSGGGGSLTLDENAQFALGGGAWLADGTIVYANAGFGLSRVAAEGGPTVELTSAGAESGLFAARIWPLPDARGVLLTLCAGNCTQASVYVYDLQTSTLSVLFETAAGAWYAPTGHVLYTERGGGLYAAAFDLDALTVKGGSVPVLDGLMPDEFTLSTSGVALYAVGDAGGVETELVWVSRDGTAEPVDTVWIADFQYPALSPDGTRLAVSIATSTDTHLWIKQLGGGQQKLTFEGLTNWRPFWTANGQQVAFVSNRSASGGLGANDLYMRRADGSAMPIPLLDLDVGVWEVAFSQDGMWMLYRLDEEGGNSNIYARQLTGDTTAVTLVATESLERQISLSPDGRWLAYASDESGRFEIYVVPFPDVDSRWLVSSAGGIEPRWSHSGRELFFRSRDAVLMTTAIRPGAAFAFDPPQPLFSVQEYRTAQNRHQYDVAPDDSRFLMIRERGGEVGTLIYVENWLQELEEKVGN